MKLSFEDIKRDNSLLKAPTDFVSMEEARNRIFETLSNEDNTLILATPGVGKTFSALKYLAENTDDKLIFYSCLNRGLKKEAFEMMKGFFDENSDQLDNIHMLQSMEEICQKNNEMKYLVNKGRRVLSTAIEAQIPLKQGLKYLYWSLNLGISIQLFFRGL